MDKVKKFFVRIFPVLNLLSVGVDLAICIFLNSALVNAKPILRLLPLVYFGFICYRVGKALYLCIRSRSNALDYLRNNRVIPIDGKQGSGKTSLSAYFAYISRSPVASNTPLKIRGKYCRVLSDNALALVSRVPDNSLLVVDECNLFYNATFGEGAFDSKRGYSSALFAQSIFCQCVRHFTDGNILYCSVDTERLPKILRSVFSCKLQTLSQSSYDFAPIGSIVISMIYSLFGVKVHTGIRRWTAKHYERVLDDQYTAIVSDDDSEFCPTLHFATLQSLTSFDYDDRYMRAFYELLPEEKEAFYNSLSLLDAKEEMMKNTEVYKLFDERTNHFEITEETK